MSIIFRIKKLLFKHFSKPYAIVMLLLTYLKLFKLTLTGKINLSLLKIALMGFSERYSLMYKQKKKTKVVYTFYEMIFRQLYLE